MLLQEDGLPPPIKDDLEWVSLDLQVKLLNMLACSEFPDLVVRSGNRASCVKYIKLLLYRTRQLIEKAGPWLSFSSSFDHFPHLSMRMESKNPSPRPQPCTHLLRGSSVLTNDQGLFLVFQHGELIYCYFKSMYCCSSLGKKFTILLLDYIQVSSLSLFHNGKFCSLASAYNTVLIGTKNSQHAFEEKDDYLNNQNE